jgi:hypothetical protein
MPRAFLLQAADKPFHYGIIQTLTLAVHPTADPACGQQALIIMTGILTPTIRMVNQPRRGAPSAQGHAQRPLDQVRGKAAAYRPSHDFAGLNS